MKKRIFPILLVLSFLPLLAGTAAAPTPPPPADPAEAARLAIEGAIRREQQNIIAYLVYETSIADLQVSTDSAWATARLNPEDPDTGLPVPAEPGLAIVKNEAGSWRAILPSEAGWREALEQAPADLMNENERAYWLEVSAAADANAASYGPFGGYYLPWPKGQTLYMTGSTSHDSYISSGNAHYAFDFAMPHVNGSSPMFPISAAKSGRVKRLKVDQPNGTDEKTGVGNFVVLEDPTTSPVTYQLYLHLAQNSVPSGLQVGSYVMQGEYLGLADDTGASTGNHLHFQVHTNAASYWGTSVDITFRDVSINWDAATQGGRPRNSKDLAWCKNNTTYHDTCTATSSTYISGNAVRGDNQAPTGDLLEPQPGAAINLDSLSLEAWVSDVGIGVAEAQLWARYNSAWNKIGNPFAASLYSYDWDWCSAGVPDGPVTLAMSIKDWAENEAPGQPGLRNIIKNYECPSPPPTCTPNSNQAALFAEADYQGACVVLSSSATTIPSPLGPGNARSIKVGANIAATVFGSAGYSGRSERFIANDPGLADNTIGSSGIASVRIQARTSLAAEQALEASGMPLAAGFSGGEDLSTGSFIFTDTLESNAAGWIAIGLWRLSADPVFTHSPAHAWWYNSESTSKYETGGTNSGDLYTPAIALPASGEAFLRFWYAYETETSGAYWDQRRVQISKNGLGGPWVDLLQLGGDPANVWLQSPAISLKNYAGETVHLRFRFDSVDAERNGFRGWGIDDISVSTTPPPDCADTNNSAAQAASLTFGSQVQETICPGGDIDFFKFTGQAGDRIVVDIDTQPTANLDTYLYLLDGDGRSPLAENDDEILRERTDSILGYQLTRSGTYYLKLQAWNHPSGGSPAAIYTLRLVKDRQDPEAAYTSPTVTELQSGGPLALALSASDAGSGVRRVVFWWHSGDWQNGDWVAAGEDADGSNGWQLDYTPPPGATASSSAVYAQVYDWAGNWVGVARWSQRVERKLYIPLSINH